MTLIHEGSRPAAGHAPADHRHVRAAADPRFRAAARLLAALSLLTMLCLLSACIPGLTPAARDDRPVADYAAFEAAVEPLDAVSRLQQTAAAVGGKPAHYTVEVDPAASPDALEATSEAIFDALDEHRYPLGTPEVRVQAGAIHGTVETNVHPAPSRWAVPDAVPLPLEQVPFLLQLPGFSSAEISARHASVELVDGTDLRAFTTAAAQQPRQLRISARRAPTDAEAALLPLTDRAGHAHGEAIELGLDLGDPTLTESTDRLFHTIETSGAVAYDIDLVDEGAGAATEPHVQLAVADAAGIQEAAAVFSAEYGSDALGAIRLRTPAGLAASLGTRDAQTFLDLSDRLSANGLTLTDFDAERDTVTIELSRPEDIATLMGMLRSADWPLDRQSSVGVVHRDSPAEGSAFSAAEWPARAALLEDLWAAGFTRARLSPYAGRTADFTVRIAPRAGRDIRTPGERRALIAALRASDWPGTAGISFDIDGHLTFTATHSSKAHGAYNSLHGHDRTPSGWAADFLTEFDETAG